jgi:DNA replication protein DnaC
MRRLARVDLLILDDFNFRPLDTTETNAFYELVVSAEAKPRPS